MKKIFTLISILSVYTVNLWAQTPNPGFESWTAHTGVWTYDTPDGGWSCSNTQTYVIGVYSCLKSASAHSGSFAVELITKQIGSPFNVLVPGIVTTGTIPTSISGSITGGIAYTLRPDSITGWYKYTPQGGEKGFVEFVLFGSGGISDTIAIGDFATPSATVSTYTRFSAPMVYRSANAVVNSIWLLSSSNNDGLSSSVGSTLYVDDLNLIFSTAGINEQEKPEFTISPNPAIDHVVLKNELNPKAIFILYDIMGHKVAEEKLANATNVININSFPGGLYLYTVIDENSTIMKAGKLIIQK